MNKNIITSLGLSNDIYVSLVNIWRLVQRIEYRKKLFIELYDPSDLEN